MIGKQSIKQAVGQDIAISDPMVKALESWSKMYENKSNWLNDYVKSLNLPAAIAREISRMATIEMAIALDGSKRADYLAEQFNNVMGKIREVIEFGCAKGGLVFKPYPDGKNISVDYIHADQFFPISFDSSGHITACVFIDQRKQGDYWYTRLESHQMTGDGYIVRNSAYRSSTKDILGGQVSLELIDDWKELEPEATIVGLDKPLFAYFRYPLANNIDPKSPLGVSCYAGATDLIKQADILWSDLMWEFESGKRALYVDASAFDKTADDKPIIPDRRLYRALNQMESAQIGEPGFYEEWSPEFREVSIKSGLNTILQRIEFNCGMAYGTLSDPQIVDKTATEIKTSKQRSYSTVVDVQKAIKIALDDLIYAMDTWATINALAPKGKYTVTYDFDDSVVVDKDAQLMTDRQTVSMGSMAKWRYLMRNYGLSEEEAKKWVAEATDEQPSETDLFQGA